MTTTPGPQTPRVAALAEAAQVAEGVAKTWRDGEQQARTNDYANQCAARAESAEAIAEILRAMEDGSRRAGLATPPPATTPAPSLARTVLDVCAAPGSAESALEIIRHHARAALAAEEERQRRADNSIAALTFARDHLRAKVAELEERLARAERKPSR